MKLRYVISSAAMVAMLAVSSPVPAQDAASMVQQRLATMRGTAGALEALGKAAAAGKVGAAEAAQAGKAATNFKKIPGLFPAGTGSDKIATRAKPEIWTDRAKFDGEASKAVAALTEIEKAAKAGDAAALGAAVKTADAGVCRTCHRAFRGPRPKK